MNIQDLNEFAGGALQEKVSYAMQEVAENVSDPNTPAKTKRKITITLTYEPTDTRDVVPVLINVKTNLAPPEGVATSVVIDADANGQIISGEFGRPIQNKSQGYIEDDGNITYPIEALHNRMED